MDRPACLEDMPLEMLAAITEHLGDAALRSLRQASRTIAVGVDLPFMDRFFTNRVHLYTHSSLDALVKITSRAHFARHIKQVTIVIMELDDECNDDPGLHEPPTLKAIATRKQRACKTWSKPQHCVSHPAACSLFEVALGTSKRRAVRSTCAWLSKVMLTV